MAGAVIERYDRFWADYLGITPAELNRPGLSIVPHVGLQGYRGIWCFRRRDRTVISAPPGWIPHLLSRLPEIREEHLMDEFALREVFGGDFDQLVGPAYQGYLIPDLFRPYVGPQVRFVRQEDMVRVEAFQKECGSDAWEIGGFHAATACLAAICEGDRIVSLAGFNRVWRDEAGGPCILTHRAYRGRGWATATTSAVVERVLREGKLVLYQTLEANTPSVRVARRLGYEQYATHVAVRLKAVTPATCLTEKNNDK
jgi:RimJ/RimL family protein N-acetyltransferase